MTSVNADCAVKIALRERPARDQLTSNFNSSVINYHPNGNNIIVNESLFTFDHVFGPAITQDQIFQKLIKPLVLKLKLGYNCTALAYGQTGTGKSYTMGLNSKGFDGDDVGVIPRCLKEIFGMIAVNYENSNTENFKPSQNTEILVSFIEIYNEKVYDLLAENANEPVARGKYTGGTRKLLKNLKDCQAILTQGNKNRHVRPTKMNAQSSRSHVIFTIHVHSKTQKQIDENAVTVSRMNIVDLAGSEGVRRTGHQGIAMSEGVHINQGLLSIGKVLQAMTAGSKVIPYRDSVLSSVLQDSLNSNSYLTLLACVSPHREDLSETLSTLRFAQNAKQLKNVPEINHIIGDIKKTFKQKHTPYKANPMKLNNTKVTVMKHSHSTLYGVQSKSAIKSNTFCTPTKERVEINKCNQTEISRPKLAAAGINLSKTDKLGFVNNNEFLFNKSLDSNGSLLSLNVSTSTDIDGHANNRNLNPVIRKCIVKLQSDFENNLLKILQSNLQTILPQTSVSAVTPRDQTALPCTLRQEIKSIVKEVIDEQSAFHADKEINTDSQTTFLSRNCLLFNNSDEIFKIPAIPSESNSMKTSSPIIGKGNSSIACESFSQNIFSQASDSNETVLTTSLRRSCRILEKHCEHSVIANDSILENSNHLLRRSSRKSVIKMYQDKRQSILVAAHGERFPITNRKTNSNSTKSVKKSKRISVNNTIIDGYCGASTSKDAKTTLSKHRKAVLDLLNKGSMKELQILPQVGQKTAYQIVTQRTLSGKFKNWTQVERLPIWRGTAWQRFAEANMII